MRLVGGLEPVRRQGRRRGLGHRAGKRSPEADNLPRSCFYSYERLLNLIVQVESGRDELGQSLWVYQVVGDEKVPLREVCWVFGHGEPDKWELAVEAYACRPEKGTDEELTVEFKDFDVKWA